MRRRSATSNRPIAAAITTAASAAVGRFCSRFGRHTSGAGDGERADDAGELRPRTRGLGDRRARRAAADREALEESRPPGSRRRAPTISWLGSTGLPLCGRVVARQHAGVGERDQRDGQAADRAPARCRHADQRQREGRQALRQRAEHRDAGARREVERRRPTTVAPTTAIRIAGHARHALQQQDDRERADADRSAIRFVLPAASACDERPGLVEQAFAARPRTRTASAAGSPAPSARCRSCSRSGSASTAAR